MKVGSYLFIMVGLMMLFNLAGIIDTSGYILTELNVIDNPEDLSFTQFILTSIGVIGGLTLAGTIIIGTLARSSPESYLLIGYSAILLKFVSDIVVIVVYSYQNYPNSWATPLIAMICIPVAIGYAHAVISWWGGRSA